MRAIRAMLCAEPDVFAKLPLEMSARDPDTRFATLAMATLPRAAR